MIIYTVIIPHYNIPDLLRRCLESIPQRDDVQVIVVDDCSSADNRRKLKELERIFSKVCFVYLECNKGGGHARNIGLQYAVGTYVLFADADDFFHDNLNAFFDDYRHETCDVVFFNADSADPISGEHMIRADRLNGYVKSYIDGKDPNALQLRYLHHEPWCRMVKKEFIASHQIKFDELFAINDVTFSYLVGFYAEDIKVDCRKLYCVTYRPGSISYSESFNRDIAQMEVLSRKNRFMRTHHIPVFDQDMLCPIRKGLKGRMWNQLNAFFSIAREYGFPRTYILYLIAKQSVECRIGNLFLSNR